MILYFYLHVIKGLGLLKSLDFRREHFAGHIVDCVWENMGFE
jgi:hypothetical protein